MPLDNPTLTFNLTNSINKTLINSAESASVRSNVLFVQGDKIPMDLTFYTEPSKGVLLPLVLEDEVLELAARFTKSNEKVFPEIALTEYLVYGLFVDAKAGLQGGMEFDEEQGENYVVGEKYVLTQGDVDLGAKAKILSIGASGGVTKFLVTTSGSGYVSTSTVTLENPIGVEPARPDASPDQSYSDPSTNLVDADFDKDATAVFAVDITTTAAAHGQIAEIGGEQVETLQNADFSTWPKTEILTNTSLAWDGATITDWSKGSSIDDSSGSGNTGDGITMDGNSAGTNAWISQALTGTAGTYDFKFTIADHETNAGATADFEVDVWVVEYGNWWTVGDLEVIVGSGSSGDGDYSIKCDVHPNSGQLQHATWNQVRFSYTNIDTQDSVFIDAVSMTERVLPENWTAGREQLVNGSFGFNDGTDVDDWSLNSGTLNATNLAAGTLKGTGGGFEVEQTIALKANTEYTLRIEANNTTEVAFNLSGSAVSVWWDNGASNAGSVVSAATDVLFVTQAAAPDSIVLSTNSTALEVDSASVRESSNIFGLASQEGVRLKADTTDLPSSTDYIYLTQDVELLSGIEYELAVDLDDVENDTNRLRLEGYSVEHGWLTMLVDAQYGEGETNNTFTPSADLSQISLRISDDGSPDVLEFDGVSVKEFASAMIFEVNYGQLRIYAGGTNWPSMPDSSVAYYAESIGSNSDLLGDVSFVWEIDPTAGTLKVWANDKYITTVTALSGFTSTRWANSDTGGFHAFGGESHGGYTGALYNKAINSNLDYWSGETVEVIDNDVEDLVVGATGRPPEFSVLVDLDGADVHTEFATGASSVDIVFDVQGRKSDDSEIRTLSRFDGKIVDDINFEGSSGTPYIPS
tara:strand:+ start:466 stop:3060 length:2595 start_codon:yes stop_codon:yes gene_type:complete